MQRVKFMLDPPLPGGLVLPSQLLIGGRLVTVEEHSERFVVIQLPEDATIKALSDGLSATLGVRASPEMLVAKPKPVVSPTDVAQEMDRLVAESLESLARMQPSSAEIDEPEATQELLGKKVWDSVFAKRDPVFGLQQWTQSAESDLYVYLPNDLSRVGPDTEDFVSNAYYTEVLANAYRLFCQRGDFDHYVRLQSGVELRCRTVRPCDGSQHTVRGEAAGRLANSKLIDFDDSEHFDEFLKCIIDLTPDQFEREPIRRRVLAKCEVILTGKTSHTYNQRFIQALYDVFVSGEDEVPWVQHKLPVASTVMGVLTQMVVEGLVISESRDLFLQRTTGAGFGQYAEDFAKIFEEVRSGHV